MFSNDYFEDMETTNNLCQLFSNYTVTNMIEIVRITHILINEIIVKRFLGLEVKPNDSTFFQNF